MQKTNSRHFKIFRNECLRLQKAWGLLDWELNFEHKKMTNLQASAQPCFGARQCYMVLSTDWNEPAYPISDQHIRDVAKHETLHLLLAPLEDIIVKRYITKEQVDDAGHAVLMRLMQLL